MIMPMLTECPINKTYTYNGQERFLATMVYKCSYEEG